MSANPPNVIDWMCDRIDMIERGHLIHESGEPMTDEQLAEMNAALGLTKDKSYRPYCLRCNLGPRVALKADGFECWHCGNRFGFNLFKP